jgi:hypothetical protein
MLTQEGFGRAVSHHPKKPSKGFLRAVVQGRKSANVQAFASWDKAREKDSR